MIDAAFISDLHLHPKDKALEQRFIAFIDWAKTNEIRKLYILGDFFHAWAGDDSLDEWSTAIAKKLRELTEHDTQLFYICGNRDFLLGNDFAQLSGWTSLDEPYTINLGDKKVLLVHGDRYCTEDKAHQRFRKLTRNSWFTNLFLKLPLSIRKRLVDKVRHISQENHRTNTVYVDVVEDAVVAHMRTSGVDTLIHGHTHKPGLTSYTVEQQVYSRYVLSDWDDNPKILCYDSSNGFIFKQFSC